MLIGRVITSCPRVVYGLLHLPRPYLTLRPTVTINAPQARPQFHRVGLVAILVALPPAVPDVGCGRWPRRAGPSWGMACTLVKH